MLYGSNYIYIQIADKVNRNRVPQYIIDFYQPQEINPSLYQIPNYVMLKFRAKDSNIDDAYQKFKMILGGKDWNVKIKKFIYKLDFI